MPDGTDPIHSENDLVITRVFDAPRALVWKVHSEAEHLARWWGPKGFVWVESDLDFRPGGRFHYCMRSPDGFEMWGKFSYHEIEAPSRIVFASSFSDPSGGTVRAPFMADFPLEILNVLSFTDENGRTTLQLRGAPLDATPAEWAAFKGMHGSMRQGFGGTYDQLEEYLSTI